MSRIRSQVRPDRGSRRPRRSALCHALALALAASAGPVLADNFVVHDEAGLIAAINAANASPGADRIELQADITLAAALPQITAPLAIHGSGGRRALRRDDTGARACGPEAENAFRPLDAVADLELADLEISGGCNLEDGGGGVRVSGADLHLVRALVTGNQTFVPNEIYDYAGGGHGGGAMVLYGSASVVGSTISDNASHGAIAGGGGIAVYGGSLELRDSTITGNRSEGIGPMGAGAYAVGDYFTGTPGELLIIDSTISANTASGYSPKGGGVYALIQAATISNSRITGNTLLGDDYEYARGGGVVITNPFGDPPSVIERSLIAGNAVTGLWAFAGGLHLIGGSATVDSTAIVDNTVTGTSKARAGGVFGETADLAFINSTISGNAISGVVNEGGGGMQLITHGDLAMTVLLLNSTVANNASPGSHSGGILLMTDTSEPVDPVLLLESSLVAGNQGLGGLAEIGVPTTPGSAPIVIANHSLVQGAIDVGDGLYLPDAASASLAGADPLLAPLAANGGPTPSHGLLDGSPAIDAGSNLFGLAWDQRGTGHPRVRGAAADIGAVESGEEDSIFANGFD